MVEVGPGGGVLTAALVAAGARVAALELDLAWGLELHRRFAGRWVAIAVTDAADVEWARLAPGTLVAGNLPYYLATALVADLLPAWRSVPRAAFLVQLEVAERLVAGPGDAAYGALSVVAAAHAAVELLGRVPRGAFRPVPAVDGAFVGLTLRRPPFPAAERVAFAATVRAAFALRRKTLRNALAAACGRPAAERWLLAAGLGPRVRAQELALEDFLRLHRERPVAARG